MSLRYRLEAECDGCGAQLAGKTVADVGSGIGGKPAEVAIVLGDDDKPIDPQPAPVEVVGVIAWRVQSAPMSERVLCSECLAETLTDLPCVIWQITRVQL